MPGPNAAESTSFSSGYTFRHVNHRSWWLCHTFGIGLLSECLSAWLYNFWGFQVIFFFLESFRDRAADCRHCQARINFRNAPLLFSLTTWRWIIFEHVLFNGLLYMSKGSQGTDDFSVHLFPFWFLFIFTLSQPLCSYWHIPLRHLQKGWY